MARQRNRTQQPQATTEAPAGWPNLTWHDLDLWAGSRSVSRGRTYQRQGHVKDLAIAVDGRLLATVMGGRQYAVSVSMSAGTPRSQKLESACTCPVGATGCKHAVAVVAEYLAALANQTEVALADPNDRRWAKLAGNNVEAEGDFEDDDFEDEEDSGVGDDWDDEASQQRQPAKPRPKPRGERRTPAQWDGMIKAYIGQKEQPELADLVWSLVVRFPELRAEFQERIALAEGDVTRLVADARKELRAVSSEVGWRNHWQGEGHTPNYSRLKHRLERLVEQGHPDEVVKLGRELIARGMQQVGESHDEGETATELTECLEVVFTAVAQSGLAAPDKIQFAIDACLADDYDVTGESTSAILEAEWPPADWSVVANRLAAQLQRDSRGKNQDDFSRNYRRDNVSSWLLTALENAGRGAELSAVYEAEARATGSYERLVKFLIEQGRTDDAERWAREGIAKTQEKLPGIASALQRLLCDVARGRKQWDVVAAHAASAFFERPSAPGFDELLAAARKAKCEEPVRASALTFLETGKSPILYVICKGKMEVVVDSEWPLPALDYLMPRPRSGVASPNVPRPRFEVLLDMAIADKRSDDVLKWYDKMVGPPKPKTGTGGSWSEYGHDSYGDQVAAAVAASHPQRALEIYERELTSHLSRADYSAYESCAGCLKKMRPIYKALDRADDWQQRIADIRQKYGNRPRFMEILDKLEGRTILQSQTASRRRTR